MKITVSSAVGLLFPVIANTEPDTILSFLQLRLHCSKNCNPMQTGTQAATLKTSSHIAAAAEPTTPALSF